MGHKYLYIICLFTELSPYMSSPCHKLFNHVPSKSLTIKPIHWPYPCLGTWPLIWPFLLPIKVNCSKFCPQGGLPFTTLRNVPDRGCSAVVVHVQVPAPHIQPPVNQISSCQLMGGNPREATWAGRKEGSRVAGVSTSSIWATAFRACSGLIMSVPLSFDDGMLAGHTQIYGFVSQIAPKSWLAAQVE